MEQSNRITTEELIAMIPAWCKEGNLVYVDENEDTEEKEKIGIILDYYVVDVDQLEKDDYDDLVHYEEWLLLDISTDAGILEAINSYSISPVTLAINIGDIDAKK